MKETDRKWSMKDTDRTQAVTSERQSQTVPVKDTGRQ
jgi:hypothetical protein